MAIVLHSKPGLSSTTTLNIPKVWDATWFRNLISNQLKGADVRNAVGANGITVTGTIASPYATISIGAGPIVIPAGAAGTTTVTVNGPSGGNALVLNGGEIINATSGTPLQINTGTFTGNSINVVGAPTIGSVGIQVENTAATTSATSFFDVTDGTRFGYFELQNATATAQVTGGVAGSAVNIGAVGGIPLQFGTNDNAQMTLAASGQLTIAAPTSGSTLIVNSLVPGTSIAAVSAGTQIIGGGTSCLGQSGGDYGAVGFNNGSTGTAGTYKYINTDFMSFIRFQAGGFQFWTAPSGTAGNNATITSRMSIAQTGAVTVAGNFGCNGNNTTQDPGWGTPTGTTLTTNFPGATATLLQTSESLARIILILKNYGFIAA